MSARTGRRQRDRDREGERKREREAGRKRWTEWSVQWPGHLQHNCRSSPQLPPRLANLPPCHSTCCLLLFLCCSQLCCISRSSNKQRQLLHLPLPQLVSLFCPSVPPSPAPSLCLLKSLVSGLVRFAHHQRQWQLWRQLQSLRAARLIGYEQLSDWFYWVAFVI